MNIILVPDGRTGKGQHACLTHRHMLVLGLAVVLVAILLGTLTYRIQGLLLQHDADLLVSAQKRELAAQRQLVGRARKEAEAHLNALAQKLGGLQAQVLRLNALGQRLTRMAGLDAREFDFSAEVAMGGPEKPTVGAPAPGLLGSLETLAREIERSEQRLTALESLLLDRKLTAAITPSGWPVQGGWVSSGFGLRSDPFSGHQAIHEGVDIASRLGSPIRALGDGVISHAGAKAGYGLLVEVTHESGLITRYAHTSAVLVKVGEKVAKGQPIARIGSSGRSTGPHLHFEVVKNGRAVNPARYLSQAAAY